MVRIAADCRNRLATRKAPGTLVAFTSALVLAGGLVGCGAERTIRITSEPSGALVHLNDDEVGRTPVEVPFLFFGTYDVRLSKEGYRSLWTMAETSPPIWEFPGPDLAAEFVGARTEVEWHFELEPLDLDDPSLVSGTVERAGLMRRATRVPGPMDPDPSLIARIRQSPQPDGVADDPPRE